MAETYCAKQCTDCVQKEVLSCPGCKVGPGRQFGGDCELARCVREKGHETCDTCGFRGNCATLRGCEHMPDYRRKRLLTQEDLKASVSKRASVLGKWLWYAFWLVIPASVAGVMANDTVAKLLPGLYVPGQFLDAAVSAVYGLILLKISSEEERYRSAGICILISSLINLTAAILSGGSGSPSWMFILTVPGALVALAGEYQEYTAHSAVLNGVDSILAEKWEKLWKWYIGLLGAMLACIVLIVILPGLGLLVLLAAAIGVVIVSIAKLVYLYQTAKCFREYPRLTN